MKLRYKTSWKPLTNLRTQQIKIAPCHLAGRSKNRSSLWGHMLRDVFLVKIMHGKEDGLVDVNIQLQSYNMVLNAMMAPPRTTKCAKLKIQE